MGLGAKSFHAIERVTTVRGSRRCEDGVVEKPGQVQRPRVRTGTGTADSGPDQERETLARIQGKVNLRLQRSGFGV